MQGGLVHRCILSIPQSNLHHAGRGVYRTGQDLSVHGGSTAVPVPFNTMDKIQCHLGLQSGCHHFRENGTKDDTNVFSSYASQCIRSNSGGGGHAAHAYDSDIEVEIWEIGIFIQVLWSRKCHHGDPGTGDGYGNHRRAAVTLCIRPIALPFRAFPCVVPPITVHSKYRPSVAVAGLLTVSEALPSAIHYFDVSGCFRCFRYWGRGAGYINHRQTDKTNSLPMAREGQRGDHVLST